MYSSDFTIDSVRVSAASAYQPDYSKPIDGHYVFSYRIRIKNEGNTPARLLRRHWIVTDGCGEIKEVEGEGVVGQQPVIQPGDFHEYDSWIQLNTPIGSMEGTFLMQQEATTAGGKAVFFQADIPKFLHVAPELNN